MPTTSSIQPVNTMRNRKSEQKLKVQLTDPELLELGRKQSQAIQELRQAEDEKKSITNQLKAKCEGIASRITETSLLISNGYEYRTVMCDTTYDEPKPGLKTTRRLDTNEVVNVEPMSLSEQQAELALMDALKLEDLLAVRGMPCPDSLLHTATRDLSGQYANTYVGFFVSFDDSQICDEATRRTDIETYVNENDAEGVERFLNWIKAERPAPLPGAAEVIAVIDAEVRRIRDVNLAKQAQAKAGRRKVTAGTVEVPSDEGSRDDAGEDSKTKL